ncbi:MAG: F0F1 ATP synthase subunit delta [Zoogloeaceae bacterium]|jgi:F-type H+-transporting ATPase subunit delta|nr:F0F1 ATP synthase subunit delta [Zoogloeaceae bacterium]
MAETVTIARPYAEAAYQAAKEAGAVPKWDACLALLALAARDERVADLMARPGCPADERARFFLALLENVSAPKGKNADKAPGLDRFIRVLAENGRLPLLPEIYALFSLKKAEDEGVREARITSAFPLSEGDIKALLPQLETHFKVKLTPSVRVDAGLIGGVRVAVGDQVLDASVRGKLDAMTIALRN